MINLNDYVGHCVEWESQSQGSRKTKRGKVICVIPPNKSLRALLPTSTKSSHIKTADDRSIRNRILVEVKTPTGISHYYTPYTANLRIITQEELKTHETV